MDNYDTLEAWAKIVIERFELKITHLKIGSRGELLKSFASQLYADSGGDVSKIVFGFLYYGRFTDMGVGKGVKIGQAGVGNNRRVKPWYAKVFFGQVYKLGKILAEKTGQQAQIAVFEGLQ
jgi:hypothetical protein